jgi:hypothetical protein
MNYLLPFFVNDSLFDYILSFVHTDTNYSHFISPDSFILLKHLLVVFHRLLTWSTPCSPNINKQYFPRSMSELGLTLIQDIIKQSIIFELSCHFMVSIKFRINLKFLEFLIDRVKFAFIDMF